MNPRRRKSWHPITMWCRRPTGVLYAVPLFLLVGIGLVQLNGVIHYRNHDKREMDPTKQSSFSIETAAVQGIPLDRVADEELEQWISLLLGEKTELKKFGAGHLNAAGNSAKSLQDSVEILGEGGSRQTDVKKSKPPISSHPDFPKEALPISGDLRHRLVGGSRQEKAAETTVLKRDRVHAHHLGERGKRKQETQTAIGNGILKQNVVYKEDGSGKYERFSGIHGNRTKRVNVLLVAAMRTGSSFLGELFQQRSDFFYMFEPGMLIMHKLDSSSLTRRVMVTKLTDMLEKFYHCKFNGMSFFIDLLNEKTLHGRKQAIPALVSSEFCRREQAPHSRPKDQCEPVSVQTLERACTGRSNTAIKSIRILDINLVQNLVQEPDVDLKIIHIVRDPRSMIVSRLKLALPAIERYNVTELTDTYRNILIRYCSNWLQNYEIGHYVPFIRKNYLMVRYEDMALQPMKFAQKVYEFVGLGEEIPAEIQDWIARNTRVNDPSQKKSAAFSTTRDSKSVLVGWKKRVTLDMAQAIEEVGDCTRLMDATGYTLIGHDFGKLNSSDHLVGVLPQPQFDTSDFDFM